MNGPASAGPPQLREDPAALSVIAARVAEHHGIDVAFVEKDFWVTEVLRAVAGGVPLVTGGKVAGHVRTVFKGGTSLSKVHGLIDRFSEDVDLLVVFPNVAGERARDKALKALIANVQTHLSLPDESCERRESTTGVKRNYRFHYPREFRSEAVEDGVLLEMGSRGGAQPHRAHTLRSMVAEYAQGQLGEPEDTWEEWAPCKVDVLSPERTLLEKLAVVHDLATRATSDSQATLKLHRAARHYYDIRQLLESEGVRQALAELGPAGVTRLAADIDDHSRDAGWPFTPRPEAGYGGSCAFDPEGPHIEGVRKAYGRAMAMVYGARPTLDECIDTVHTHGGLL